MLDGFFASIDNKAWFEGIGSGVPALIALFLVVFAHWAISPKLRAATEGRHDEDAELYRNQIRLASRVGIALFLLHAGFFIFNQITQRPAEFIVGKVQELKDRNQITLINDPDRIYVRQARDGATGVTYHWVIRASGVRHRPQFRIVTSHNIRYDCKFDQAVAPGQDIRLQAVFDDFGTEALKGLEMYGAEDAAAVQIGCALSPNQVISPQDHQPDSGAPLDLGALAPDALPRHGGLWQRLGLVAHAGERLAPGLEVLLEDLRDDDYRVRDAAQARLAADLGRYATWAEHVATGRYVATEREVMGLTWALSRQDDIPRPGMFAMPDISADLVNFVLAQAIAPNLTLRENAKRFAITYPVAEMGSRLQRAVADADGRAQGWATDALAHFAYNRAVLITMAHRDGQAGAPPLSVAAEALDRAEALAGDLPPDLQVQYAKTLYAKGWLNAVAAGEGLTGPYSEAQAQEAFGAFVDRLEQTGTKSYRYPWQLDIARAYAARPDYGLFNK